ncbi:MAG: hypothetical protein LBD12_02580 [Clostridiales Family XIII bacterium]|nr:hypothetical protein [Clostridiales Family XIII bacterium]
MSADALTSSIRAQGWSETFSLEKQLDSIERGFICEALLKSDNNQSKAATLLGISRFSLKRRMEKHGL